MTLADAPAPAPEPRQSRFRRTMGLAKYGRFCCCCICLKPDEAEHARRIFRLARRVTRDQ